MADQDNARIARAIYDAFNDRDFDAGTALVTDDAEWLNVATGQTFRGPEGVRQNYEQWATAYPDGRCEDIEILAGEGFAVVQFTGRGKNTGPLGSPAGEIPATGRSVDVPFCDVLEIRAGKIAGGKSYFDMATMMRQLGLMPDAVGAAT